MSALSAADLATGGYTHRLCVWCRTRRCMPRREAVCRFCAPEGGPRLWMVRGYTLVYLREALGYSAYRLAQEAGVSDATVSRAEGKAMAHLHATTALALAEALGVLVDDLGAILPAGVDDEREGDWDV